jgi:hypothetical protein
MGPIAMNCGHNPESEDDEEKNFQINNEDVEGCDSDDEETRVAMCEILGGMSLSSKKND